MSLADTPTSAVGAFVDRIPATAGDRLGIEITTGPYLGNAQCRAANTGSTSDRTATSFAAAPLGADHVFDADPAYTKFLPNILANYEHDTDGDKYGDATQDLCVGDPAHSTTACSGTLMGSQLSGARPHPYNCVTTCTLFQQTSNGAQTTAPYNGVIVRWRLQPFAGVTAKLRVMHKTDNYYATMDGTGDPATVSTTTPGEITTIPSRLAVKQGDWVAIELQGPANMGFIQDPNSGWSAVGSGIPDGGQNIWGGSTPIPGSLPFDYDLEPDADLDGYGDITQDQCSTDPAEQGACPRPVA
jgi:hypothetical protein